MVKHFAIVDLSNYIELDVEKRYIEEALKMNGIKGMDTELIVETFQSTHTIEMIKNMFPQTHSNAEFGKVPDAYSLENCV